MQGLNDIGKEFSRERLIASFYQYTSSSSKHYKANFHLLLKLKALNLIHLYSTQRLENVKLVTSTEALLPKSTFPSKPNTSLLEMGMDDSYEENSIIHQFKG